MVIDIFMLHKQHTVYFCYIAIWFGQFSILLAKSID